jgi:hypothetical protein
MDCCHFETSAYILTLTHFDFSHDDDFCVCRARFHYPHIIQVSNIRFVAIS